ncbi:TMEM175 family protein [Leptolyngbya sp. NK1-12]|uniref:TMEM175 family protein n=1 Tax=Leptolyngbya sp. NK1-12 TaxID=2547451 RepID=UPI00292D1C11|nr:TMEM175 family protein [Leptolyngbya sp. NK1-12]
MTLLVIEIKVPDLSQATASTAIDALIHAVPHILSYITSFLVIGVLWLNHHALFHLLRRVDRIVLTINLVLLMCIAFIPFPTALIGEYGKLQPIVMFYGLTLSFTGIVYNVLWFYVVRQYLWDYPQAERRFIYQASLWSIGYPIFYLIASLLSLSNTTLSTVLYILIPLFYLFPSVIDRQLGKLPSSEVS